MKRWLWSTMWCCTGCIAVAQPVDLQTPSDIAGARRQIEEVRSRETSRFDAADADCKTRFAVNDCLRNSQTQRRAAMAELRKQESSLHALERQQRGQEQTQRVAQKAKERQQQDQEVADAHATRIAEQAQKQSDQQEKRAANKNIALNPSAKASETAKSPAGPAPAQQAANRSAYEQRQVEALQHKQELEKRNVEKTGKPASALPLPQ